ncbi:uncharacterized protein LOC135492501 [Lineus longissimus]|uniref:uncharacterized protein LOC135492501 n=1 Tax=Lineus longissimus TaxID=88925 RepID=UPI002B4EADA6
MAQQERPTTPNVRVLNAQDTPPEDSTSAVKVSQDLQRLMLRMKGEFMDAEGAGVKYNDLKKAPIFSEYKKMAASLKTIDLEPLSVDERKVLFLNVYNVLTIHGLVDLDEIPTSVLNIQQFWKSTAYDIGGYVFTLDDIEHGILRANRGHPASTHPQFGNTDPRLKFALKEVDPRIHFALVCGAKSCPAINVYSEKNLDRALEAAAKNFCHQEVTCHIKFNEIGLSKIFQWYREDFGKTDVDAIRWAMSYVCEDVQYGISLLLEKLEEEGKVEIKYRDYNWRLNKV